MANFVFNIAKGRVVEFYNRVENNDPSTSALVVVALQSLNIESDATIADYDTLSAVLAAATNEAVNTGYARKTLTDADLAALPAPDDTNNWFQVDIPDQTWTGVTDTGSTTNPWAKILICYDPVTGSGTDTEIIPLTAHDFAVTPDGSDIVMQVDANGFFRAQ